MKEIRNYLVMIIFLVLISNANDSAFTNETDTSESAINWQGVRGPYRFENYCSPKEGVSWSVWGNGRVSFQSIETGLHESRVITLPHENFDDGFYGVWFDDRGNGWVVGGKGTILHTSNNGASWQQQVSKTTETLLNITCIEANNCWVIGSDDVVLRTMNGGKTWERLKETSGSIVDFVSKKDGWIADTATDTLYRTTDRGRTWVRLADGEMENKILQNLFNSIKFIDKGVGWAGGLGKLGHTTDGGKTWKITEIEGGNFVGIVAHDKKSAVAVNRGEWNYCTEDAGTTWKKCFRRKDIESR